MTANGTAAQQGLGSSRRSRRTLILLGAAFFMVSGIIVLGLQVAGFGNTDTVTVTVPISTNAPRTAASAAPSSEKPPAGRDKETALTPSPPHATHSGPRLTNGGPGQVYPTASWAEARKDFVRPVTVLEPIPTIWDWATVGPCSEALAVAAPSTTWADAEGVIPSLLGRVRLSALLCVGPVKDRAALEARLKELLWKRAPAWRLVSIFSNTGHIVVERRQRVFIFGITGGRDRRAGYVERTWGRRTPIQWYGDEWDPVIRPIIDLHPKYIEDRFNLLTFKISRIWQRVYEDFGPNATALTKPPVELEAGGSGYRWYIRLWDDNYFYEENLHPALSRLDPRSLVMAGKMGWRNMGISAKIIYPFAGGGAGWYLSEAALAALGPSIAAAEKWFVEFRAKKDIFLPHAIHDEDVFLSAWLSILKVRFINIPGVEHVSPGKHNKQRCMDLDQLRALRWDANYTIYFNYPGIEAALRIEDAIYAYFKPIIWHYMSPTRLLALETLLYPERREEFANDKPAKTAADTFKWGKPCYPGVPPGPPPPRGKSLFETPLLDPPVSGG